MDAQQQERDAAAKKFIEEVIELGKRYGFSISHEDYQGAFQIVPHNKFDEKHFRAAILPSEVP